MLGDVGTLIPLLVGMAKEDAIDITAAIFWMGVFNIISSYQWDLPMPVQPMKSIAAAAISDGLTAAEVSAAGIFTGGVVMLLGGLGVIEALSHVVPLSVISGIQLGLGLRMVVKGVKYNQGQAWWGLDSRFTGIMVAVIACALQRFPRVPVSSAPRHTV